MYLLVRLSEIHTAEIGIYIHARTYEWTDTAEKIDAQNFHLQKGAK